MGYQELLSSKVTYEQTLPVKMTHCIGCSSQPGAHQTMFDQYYTRRAGNWQNLVHQLTKTRQET